MNELRVQALLDPNLVLDHLVLDSSQTKTKDLKQPLRFSMPQYSIKTIWDEAQEDQILDEEEMDTDALKNRLITSLEISYTELFIKAEKYKNERKQLLEKYQAVQKENKAWEDEYSVLKGLHNQTEADYIVLQQNAANLKKENDDLIANFASLETQYSELKKTNENLKKQAGDLGIAYKDLTNEFTSFKVENDKQVLETRELKLQYNGLEQKFKDLMENNKKLEQKFEDLMENNKKMLQELAKMNELKQQQLQPEKLEEQGVTAGKVWGFVERNFLPAHFPLVVSGFNTIKGSLFK